MQPNKEHQTQPPSFFHSSQFHLTLNTSNPSTQSPSQPPWTLLKPTPRRTMIFNSKKTYPISSRNHPSPTLDHQPPPPASKHTSTFPQKIPRSPCAYAARFISSQYLGLASEPRASETTGGCGGCNGGVCSEEDADNAGGGATRGGWRPAAKL